LCGATTSNNLNGALEGLRRDFVNSVIAARYPELSWSAGIADFDPLSKDMIEDLLQAADARMYHAKMASKLRRSALG
jgi:GGDEF domain-containing protein